MVPIASTWPSLTPALLELLFHVALDPRPRILASFPSTPLEIPGSSSKKQGDSDGTAVLGMEGTGLGGRGGGRRGGIVVGGK